MCPTKLLWTSVRGAIVRTLQDTTLADLILGPSLGLATGLPAETTGAATLPTLPAAAVSSAVSSAVSPRAAASAG